MKLKNNKGITIIGLVVAVIILMIMATITVNISLGIINTAKFENVKTELMLIQTKVKVMADRKAIGEVTEEQLYGTKQTSGTYSGWYLLSQDDLDEMGIENADANDTYYVDYETDDVALGVDVNYDGTTYHKLSEMIAE